MIQTPKLKANDLIHVRRMRGTGFRNDALRDVWGLLGSVAGLPGLKAHVVYRLSNRSGGGLQFVHVLDAEIIPHRKVPPEVQAALMRHYLT